MICHQRRIRENEQKAEPRERDSTLAYRVERIELKEARAFILRYEYLGTMGHSRAVYGARNATGELVAVASFGEHMRNASPLPDFPSTCLERGACAHWAHPHCASWFIPRAVKMAACDNGWKVFYAYADSAAGEIGTIYQACNWYCIGHGTKAKYVHLEGDRRERRAMRAALTILPYPKRDPNVKPPAQVLAERGYILHSAKSGRHRTPYVAAAANPDGSGLTPVKSFSANKAPMSFTGKPGPTWRRARGRYTRADYVQRFPLRACAHCGTLYAPRRADAKTCSLKCRVARHRATKRTNNATC